MDNESKRDKEIGSQVGKWNCKLFSSKVGYEGGGESTYKLLKIVLLFATVQCILTALHD
jgi:hypothetical protein